MKVAIVGRLEDYEEDYLFNKRYTIDYPFREMFDVLNILIIPVPFPGKEYKYDEYKLDKEVIDLFVKAKKPILGICGGMQTLNVNVYFGGDLNQNVLNHKLEDNSKHKAKITQDSFLYSVYQKECGNIIGVQWHPEALKDIEFFDKFFKTFVK